MNLAEWQTIMNCPLRVIFFGDSTCFGQFVSPCYVWVTEVSRLLSELPQGERIECINASINGNTTRMALERMPYDVQSHHPDVLHIQFGMNDCNYWKSDPRVPRVSPNAFAANIEEIIQRARNLETRKIFVATNHPTPRTNCFEHHPDLSYQSSNAAYNAIIREVAAKHSIPLIDHDQRWHQLIDSGANLRDLLLPDGIHLSRQGHRVYTEEVGRVLIGAVRELLCDEYFSLAKTA